MFAFPALSGLAGKALAIGALVLIVAGYVSYQKIVIANLRAEVSKLEKTAALLEGANERQAEVIKRLTRDAAEFKERADAARAALATARARVEVRTETVIKRIVENAKPDDRAPVSPALRDALGSVGAER